MNPYTIPLEPVEGLFFAIFLIGIPTIVVGIKTQNVVPPMMTLIFGSFLVSPFVGQFGKYFMFGGGVLLGLLFYLMAKGVR